MEFVTTSDVPTSSFSVADNAGALVVIKPTEHVHDVDTDYGKKDAIRCDVYVLDGPNAGEEYPDTFIFQGRIIGVLKRVIGRAFVGRIGQGVASKAGHNPPWQLVDATEADKAAANAWVAQRQQAQAAAGAPTTIAAPPAPAPQPAAPMAAPQTGTPVPF